MCVRGSPLTGAQFGFNQGQISQVFFQEVADKKTCLHPSRITPVFINRATYLKCVTKQQQIWCCSLYINIKLANNAIFGCMYTDICKHIMFTVRADHHGTSIIFHFHVCLKALWNRILTKKYFLSSMKQRQHLHNILNSI